MKEFNETSSSKHRSGQIEPPREQGYKLQSAFTLTGVAPSACAETRAENQGRIGGVRLAARVVAVATRRGTSTWVLYHTAVYRDYSNMNGTYTFSRQFTFTRHIL